MKRVDRHIFGASPTRTVAVLSLVLLLCASAILKPGDCKAGERETKANGTNSVQDVRRGFATHLIRKQKVDESVQEPPPRFFRVVKYDSPAGKLAAYLSPSPQDGKKHPAVIWLFGGFSNSIGETAWEQGTPDNDQSASAFREAGIVMMYPSLRGGNNNPGFVEGFYGEVDDVLGALDYLTKLDYVDPKRIYLGGHSTGGTLALLIVESTDRFRAVFSFGPVEDASGYGSKDLPFDLSSRKEVDLRAPIKWLHLIRSPTFVIEWTEQRSNIDSVMALSRSSRNPLVHFHPVKGANHFSVLAPVSRLVASKILRDDGSAANIKFSESDLAEAVHK